MTETTATSPAGKKEKETSLVRGKRSIACKVLNRMARGLE